MILFVMEMSHHAENGIIVTLKEHHAVPRTSRTFFNPKMQVNRSETCSSCVLLIIKGRGH